MLAKAMKRQGVRSVDGFGKSVRQKYMRGLGSSPVKFGGDSRCRVSAPRAECAGGRFS